MADNDSVFSEVLKNARDVTDMYDLDFGGLPEQVVETSANIKPILNFARQEMENRIITPDTDPLTISSGLIDMSQWSQSYTEMIYHYMSQGQIAAVDGTPLVKHKNFINDQVFGCAVGVLTHLDRVDLDAKITRTHVNTKFTGNLQGVTDLVHSLQSAIKDSSWPTAFMEYQERQRALEIAAGIVIIDGALITQNLLTRKEGLKLLKTVIDDTSKKYVGVLKNLAAGQPVQRLFARSLKQGEAFVIGDWSNYMGQAMQDDNRYGGFIDDFNQFYGSKVLRGVYRPGIKSYAFECRREDLPIIISLLWLDRNNQPGYEIPFLQAQVDREVQSRYSESAVSNAVMATLMNADIEAYYDELDERALR